MKKDIYYIVYLLFFLSCQSERENGLKVELINDTIFCVSNLNYIKIHNKSVIYDSNYNKFSMNIVKYKIHNNSDKKYFIVLNTDFFEHINENDSHFPESNNKNSGINSMSFSLFNDEKVLGGNGEPPFASKFLDAFKLEKSRLILDTFFYQDLNYKYKYKIKNYFTSRKIKYIEKNRHVIYPDETKYFTTIINLPLRNYEYDYISWYTLIERNKKYQAGLTLYNNAEETKKYLTPDLKKEIEENGYTIFDGFIQSNKVPVKMVKMPEN